MINLFINMKITGILFILFILGCNHQEKKNKADPKADQDFRDKIIQSHQAFLEKENSRIDKYIDSLDLEFVKTGTGLRYFIKKEKPQGDTIKSGDHALITYQLMSLEGDTLYTSPEGHVQEFMVDFEDVERGLHEGIKYLKTGESAIFILPAHLAHGITGDQAAIGPQTTLVYHLTVVGKK
mgnify:CR=1 FL=1